MSLLSVKAVSVAALIGAAAAVEGTSPVYTAKDPVGDHYLVRFDDNININSPTAKNVVGSGNIASIMAPVHIIEARLTPDQVEKVRNDKSVAYVQQVKKVRVPKIIVEKEDENVWPDSATEGEVFPWDGTLSVRPTTPGYLWGLDRIDQVDLPLDGNQSRNLPGDGDGVDVYVVDTGVDITHPQIEGRAFHFFTDNGVAQHKNWTFEDIHGHGTHCSGTIAGKTFGVAPNARIFNVKVMNAEDKNDPDGPWGGMASVIRGLLSIADRPDKTRPAVVSMSLGDYTNDDAGGPAEYEAIKKVVESGAVVIVAAGNDNEDSCKRTAPAMFPEVLTVGAINWVDLKSGFSSFGECVDIWAPGSTILSSTPGNKTAYFSGTSMATPHTAGAAAVYLSIYPTASPKEVQKALIENATPDAIGKTYTADKTPGAAASNALPSNPPSPNKILNANFPVGECVSTVPHVRNEWCAATDCPKNLRPVCARKSKFAPAAEENQRKCVSGGTIRGVTDEWCQRVACDSAYVKAGVCKWVGAVENWGFKCSLTPNHKCPNSTYTVPVPK